MAAYGRRQPGAHPRQWAVRFEAPGNRLPATAAVRAAPPRYRLHLGWEPRWYTVVIADHVWSPDAYAALAESRIGNAPRSGTTTPRVSDADFLATLADLRVSVLQKENTRLSEALDQDRLDPQLHEQAALLLSAFSLREAAGSLTDERYALSRTTAHLAFARALRGGREPGLSGRFAEIAVLTLVGRQRDAIERLAGLRPTATSPPGLVAWARALTLRNAEDWRGNKGSAATRLEQIHEFRALRNRLSTEEASRYLGHLGATTDTIWRRVTFRGPGVSVADCSRFAHAAVPEEIEELKAVWTGLDESAPSDDDALVSTLNEMPAPGGVRFAAGTLSLRVLDKGLWAALLQRQLCDAIETGYFCYEDMWGMSEAAARYSQEARKRFSKLSLFPFVSLRLAHNEASYDEAFVSATRILEAAPERAGATLWVAMRSGRRKVPMPDPGLWFSPPFPRNTIYDRIGRFRELDSIYLPTLEQEATWRAMAPYDPYILWSYIWLQHHGSGPAEEMRRESALFVDYDVWMLARVVDAAFEQAKENPAAFKKAARQLCELDPDHWRDLGIQLVELGDAAGAAEAFRTMVEKGRDAVMVSSDLLWLVLYDLDHGRPDEARQLAERAAEAYSGTGLDTMGLYLEKTGRYEEALEYNRKIVERYEDRTSLVAFYLRNEKRFRGTAIEREGKPVVEEIFPHGLETVRLEDMVGRPSDGLVVGGNAYAVRKAGLLIGDVIVGLNGKRARNWEQYAVIHLLDPSSSIGRRMRLIFWRLDRYMEREVAERAEFNITTYR